MKTVLMCLAAVVVLTVSARAAEVPEDLVRSAPEAAEELLSDADLTAGGLTGALASLVQSLGDQAGAVVRQRLRGAAAVLLVVVLCGAAEGFFLGSGMKAPLFLPMAGALSVTVAAAGSLDTLMGLGAATIDDLSAFSQTLLPTLAAAAAASGAVTTATVQQVATVFLVDLLIRLIDRVCLPLNRLGALAEGVKKVVTWLLTGAVLAFTAYLSVVRVITGSADAVTVKMAKAAISGVVPVVGGIISDASETVLAGAGMLKNTIGIFGTLAILAACAYPFLQLGVQYLLYKLTAFLAGAVGAPGLCKLIDGLGGAFGLILGMTGSCALLLLVSVLATGGAVTP